jgi:hypothetical protein
MAGFATEAIARERAKKDMPRKDVTIIESRGEFFVEPSDECPMIRSWERECYTGKGAKAVPRGGYFTCKRCATFNASPADACKRCGLSVDAGVPSGVGL